jgi:hypothetical protein
VRIACCAVTIALVTTPAQSQPRAAPSARAVSRLTTADSTALVEAAARHVLSPSDAAQRCVRRLADSVGGTVGAAFLREARILVAARPAADRSASSDNITLIGLQDGDSAAVVMRHGGSGREVFWKYVIGYYFARDSASSGWRYVARRMYEASDSVMVNPDTSRAVCREFLAK